ncbi:MAG: hypothetical protein OEX01_05385 [Candidatus Bathyarchaeota archaeon]|nr:hypothetical protein [Candidatus Bathyarchaeota archaeon]
MKKIVRAVITRTPRVYIRNYSRDSFKREEDPQIISALLEPVALLTERSHRLLP